MQRMQGWIPRIQRLNRTVAMPHQHTKYRRSIAIQWGPGQNTVPMHQTQDTFLLTKFLKSRHPDSKAGIHSLPATPIPPSTTNLLEYSSTISPIRHTVAAPYHTYYLESSRLPREAHTQSSPLPPHPFHLPQQLEQEPHAKRAPELFSLDN